MPVNDFLENFINLPKELQEVIGSDKALAAISELEGRYNVELTEILMKVMTKDLDVNGLPKIFQEGFSLTGVMADKLAKEIAEKIFSGIEDYLGIVRSRPISKSLPKKILIKEIGVEEILNKIIRGNEISFEGDYAKKRFSELITSTLKEIRTTEELLDALTRSAKIGGMGFSADLAEKITEIVDGYLKEVKSGAIIIREIKKVPTPLPKVAKPVVSPAALPKKPVFKPSFAPSYAILKQTILKKEPPRRVFKVEPKSNPLENSTWKELEDKFEGLSKIKEIEPAEEKKEITSGAKAASSKKSKESPLVFLKIQRLEDGESDRPKMADIKTPIRVMGPIDEIGSLSMKSFRLLSSDPFSAAQIIKSKIDLLEDESYEKRSQAILAWRKSPLFSEYLKIGRTSFNDGQEVASIIAKTQNSLTIEEFKAISDLNSQIRY